MNWEQMIPRKQGGRYHSAENAQKFIRVSFSRAPAKKNATECPGLRLYIGKEIATTLLLQRGTSKIDFFVDRDNPKKWLIKKTPLNSKTGYPQLKSTNTSDTTLCFMIRWKSDVWTPSAEDYGIKRISHTFEHEGVIVDFDKEL